ncbi:hypothetical protein M409DRAFT_17392 [Zasmidium cellare ATCC 36951]|uniref:Uncharacterized protein n=1 Tax=Zasmidium cellare ATCC 36951 TaxID=1080233 RepID=A0A6A6CYI5_ZASCE|nr:uncharacterized protein M409DRAFT_17392 [Zasmidium cellare ATCC 36951]KAF2172151.1 hypothetical protein M409DRAFT_17392 [Zasmidium cellare ATCC 36951]
MEWKKKWQMGGGTAEVSLSIDPGRAWKKEEEKFEDWEVVDTPPYEEMKRFHGTAPPPKKQITEHESESTEPVTTSGSIAERRGQELPSASTSKAAQTADDTKGELHPCDRCNSYHYVEDCVYYLPDDKWLEYYTTHMPSVPLRSPDPEGPLVKKHQIRMTESGRTMLEEDVEHRRKRMLDKGRKVPKDLSVAELRERWERARREEGSEDELATGSATVQEKKGYIKAVRPERSVRFVQ